MGLLPPRCLLLWTQGSGLGEALGWWQLGRESTRTCLAPCASLSFPRGSVPSVLLGELGPAPGAGSLPRGPAPLRIPETAT